MASQAGPKQRRRRNVLSCVECHRRKEKCDRQLPCRSCSIRQGAVCRYEEPKLLPTNARNRRGLPFGRHPEQPGKNGERVDLHSIYFKSEIKNFVPAGLYPIGSPRFMDIWESRWTPATAMCPHILQSTDAWARASLEAIRGTTGSREMMWHRGKVLGLMANRLNHMGYFIKMSENLSKAIVLLVQLELVCENADEAAKQLDELQDLAQQIRNMEKHGLDRLIRDCILVAETIIAFMQSRSPHFTDPARPSRSFFESRLLASSPLSPLEFAPSSYTLGFDATTAAMLNTVKQLALGVAGRSTVMSLHPDDGTLSDIQTQPAGSETVIAAAASIWTRSILSRVPFTHHLNTLDRLALFDSLFAIGNLEEVFRYMPGVLFWVLMTGCAAVGPSGFERGFLLPIIQRWAMALLFCTSAAAVVEMVDVFRAVETYVGGQRQLTSAAGSDALTQVLPMRAIEAVS